MIDTKKMRELALAAGGEEWVLHPLFPQYVIRAAESDKWIGGCTDPVADERNFAAVLFSDYKHHRLPEDQRKAAIRFAAAANPAAVLALLDRLERAEADAAALRDFAQEIMSAWPDGGIDGADLESVARDHGLLAETHPTEPCGEGCNCAWTCDADDWADGSVTCYQRTPLLTGDAAIDAARGEDK